MYDLISFVLRGKIRYMALTALTDPRTPTQLAAEIKTHQSTVSRALKSLEKKGLVTCLTPNEKVYRLYQITTKGKKLLKKAATLKGSD